MPQLCLSGCPPRQRIPDPARTHARRNPANHCRLRQAAKNAIKAGFDGVEFHAANGYLPQQFLADSSNQRNDEYGGSIENKARFTLEAMQAIIAAIGGDKVGIKISPLHPYAGIAFNDPVATYHYLIGALNKLDFSFVEIMKRSPAFAALPAG